MTTCFNHSYRLFYSPTNPNKGPNAPGKHELPGKYKQFLHEAVEINTALLAAISNKQISPDTIEKLIKDYLIWKIDFMNFFKIIRI